MEEIRKPLSVNEFAEIKNVPAAVIIKAIEDKKIIPIEVDTDPSLCTIHPLYLDSFNAELISVPEYAKRKGVSVQAVHHKLNLGKIEYFVDELTSKIKIDWIAFQDITFRSVTYKYISKRPAKRSA